MDSTPDAPATTLFRTGALPVLAAASPALAAGLAIRTRRTGPHVELSPLHCPRCGSLALRTRLERQRQSRSSRGRKTNKAEHKRPRREQRSPPPPHGVAIRRTCAACGFSGAQAVSVAGDPARASLKADFPKCASARALSSAQAPNTRQRPSDNIAEDSAIDFASATVQSAPGRQQPHARASVEPKGETSSFAPAASKRTKKRSGLQEMLARSREQRNKKEDDAPGNGLAAFLSGL